MTDGRWEHRGDTEIYTSDWLTVATADVTMPDGTRLDHHVVRMPRPAAGVLMVADGHALLLYRHRFITDSWGWEITAGGVDPGETPREAGRREALEESGWEPQSLTEMCRFHPSNGVLDQTFHLFVSDDAVHRGDPSDPNEATRIEWVETEAIRSLLTTGEILDGLSFGAISYAFAAGLLG